MVIGTAGFMRAQVCCGLLPNARGQGRGEGVACRGASAVMRCGAVRPGFVCSGSFWPCRTGLACLPVRRRGRGAVHQASWGTREDHAAVRERACMGSALVVLALGRAGGVGPRSGSPRGLCDTRTIAMRRRVQPDLGQRIESRESCHIAWPHLLVIRAYSASHSVRYATHMLSPLTF